MKATGGVGVRIGAEAKVYCVHDREKRVVTTEKRVAMLGLEFGIHYNPRLHKLHRCSCCENLFFDPADTPRYCRVCGKPPVHLLGGPLPEPEGVVG